MRATRISAVSAAAMTFFSDELRTGSVGRMSGGRDAAAAHAGRGSGQRQRRGHSAEVRGQASGEAHESDAPQRKAGAEGGRPAQPRRVERAPGRTAAAPVLPTPATSPSPSDSSPCGPYAHRTPARTNRTFSKTDLTMLSLGRHLITRLWLLGLALWFSKACVR
jgi:hypothetical protein